LSPAIVPCVHGALISHWKVKPENILGMSPIPRAMDSNFSIKLEAVMDSYGTKQMTYIHVQVFFDTNGNQSRLTKKTMEFD
jgi:hypothetical protein